MILTNTEWLFLCYMWCSWASRRHSWQLRRLGLGNVLYAANPAPKWHSWALPTGRVEHCKSLPKWQEAFYTHFRELHTGIIQLSPLSTQQKLSQHQVQSTVTSTSEQCYFWVSFVSQTFRQRLLQTKSTKIKRSTEEQSIQDTLLRISEANATSVNSWM